MPAATLPLALRLAKYTRKIKENEHHLAAVVHRMLLGSQQRVSPLEDISSKETVPIRRRRRRRYRRLRRWTKGRA